jgi:hypothetical protein
LVGIFIADVGAEDLGELIAHCAKSYFLIKYNLEWAVTDRISDGEGAPNSILEK